ncbi:MAG: alpha-amylase [Patescibacteria group bacterium]
MAPFISFYFQVHQPYRLRDLRITEIGREGLDYFDRAKNEAVFRKVAEKCYLPANRLMLHLLRTHPEFRIAYSLSGVFLDQCEEYGQDVLRTFQDLAATGRVEFLGETYYHSLSYLSSLPEFCEQVAKHARTIERLFGQKPRIFRNTELVYCNELAEVARLLGFRGILAEGADHILSGRTPNVPYQPPRFHLPANVERVTRKYRLHSRPESIRVLLKNFRLSDDVAFRFSDKSWVGYPLNAETFTEWAKASGGHNVNLYMDYETFGEHQWEDTGIFAFLEALPRMWEQWGAHCATPSEVLESWGEQTTDIFDAHTFVSWADIERDLSAWRGNHIQEAAFAGIYALEHDIKATGDVFLLDTWRRLQTSDHFYYMCTKYWSDGDVHKYFSPYESPYEAYRRYSHALCDLRKRLERSKNQELGIKNASTKNILTS